MPCRRVSREVVFTTHTPVPAGHDRFNAELMEEHLGPHARCAGHLAAEASWRWDARIPATTNEDFCMTVLGLETLAPRQRRFRSARRGFARHVDRPLSRQAGRRSSHRTHHQRRACSFLAGAADVPPLRPPSGHGLAASTVPSPAIWEGIENVDDGELWETHFSLKSPAAGFCASPGGRTGRAPRRIGAKCCSDWAGC